MDTVLKFWFEELTRAQHFKKDLALDALIKERYETLLVEVKNRQHDALAATPEGVLSLIIVLDQFSRNIYRNMPESFAQDEQALQYAMDAVAAGLDQLVPLERRGFLYMPYMHSESLEVQTASLPLFLSVNESMHEYAVKHRDIIVKFGRFPHRNAILGRESTPEEAEFLTQEGSSF